MMAGCTPDLHVFIYSGLIANYKPQPGERCICGEYSVEEMEAKGKILSKLELENARLRSALVLAHSMLLAGDPLDRKAKEKIEQALGVEGEK